MDNKVNIWFAQIDIKFGDKSANLLTMRSVLEQNLIADLLVFPELCITWYIFDNKEQLLLLAEVIDWPITQEVIAMAREYNTYIVYWFPELLWDEIFDTTVLVWPDGLIGSYQKSHLFNMENLIFTPGQTGYLVYTTPIWRIWLINCFDYMYPESIRTLALQWVQIVCNTANLITSPIKVNTCMRASAFQNQVYTITTNRVGEEKWISFVGGSEIVWPDMVILAIGKDGQSDIQIISINPWIADNKIYKRDSETWEILNNLLVDRRTDLYTL